MKLDVLVPAGAFDSGLAAVMREPRAEAMRLARPRGQAILSHFQ